MSTWYSNCRGLVAVSCRNLCHLTSILVTSDAFLQCLPYYESRPMRIDRIIDRRRCTLTTLWIRSSDSRPYDGSEALNHSRNRDDRQ